MDRMCDGKKKIEVKDKGEGMLGCGKDRGGAHFGGK